MRKGRKEKEEAAEYRHKDKEERKLTDVKRD
jgi:hypothetical protein